jgi:hypothetical protein
MTTRFDKALQQVAQADRNLKAGQTALESHAQKVRRLEELIRAKEATGDRIVMSMGAALVVSSMALPVYAAFFSNGYAYLPTISSTIADQSGKIADRLEALAPSVTGSVSRQISSTAAAENAERPAPQRVRSVEAPFARYVIHRATAASALIEGPSGLWWVTPGMKVPGAGQILAIEHSEAGWAVVTSETTITEASAKTQTN